MRDLQCLPYGLASNQEVLKVVEMFRESLWAIISYPEPQNDNDDLRFRELVQWLLKRHHSSIVHMSHGLSQEIMSDEERLMVQPFLDRFFLTRIGNRMMMSQYLELRSRPKGWVGVVQKNCHLREVIRQCVEEVTYLSSFDGVVPQVSVTGPDVVFSYVPLHLRYIIFEVLANAIRATVKMWKGKGSRGGEESVVLPMIRIVISDGDEDVVVKVSDRGGGFPRKDMKQLWTHFYSTEDHEEYYSTAAFSTPRLKIGDQRFVSAAHQRIQTKHAGHRSLEYHVKLQILLTAYQMYIPFTSFYANLQPGPGTSGMLSAVWSAYVPPLHKILGRRPQGLPNGRMGNRLLYLFEPERKHLRTTPVLTRKKTRILWGHATLDFRSFASIK